jgi:hypothetical protein
MYKICTLLSTDYVDNALSLPGSTGWEALLHAVSGAMPKSTLASGTMTRWSVKARMVDRDDLFMNKTP